jgi:hypothetical protein
MTYFVLTIQSPMSRYREISNSSIGRHCPKIKIDLGI